MSARQEIMAVLAIGGRVDNSFGKIGNALTGLGYEVDKISQRLISFGKESLDLYAGYDDDLRAIKMKIGDATSAEMDELDKQMAAWAASTRYHATDVSSAVKEATTSGWKLEDIYSGMPLVLDLAAAAEMGLVDAMEYLNSAMAGQGVAFSNGEKFIDQWLKTANNTRANVAELGESMETLGSLASFADSTEELYTILGAMANFGTKGSEAGTLLRAVLLRVIAPTKKASDALAELGATEAELAELENADLGLSAQRMAEMGFSAYDAQGNLKPLIQIVNELRDSLDGMTEQERYTVLSDIFPTRTIRGILDLLKYTEDEYASLMATITDSDGYAAAVADYQEAGIGGAMRTFESRVEELERVVGDALDEETSWALDTLGEWALGLASIDEDAMNVLVGGLTGIAAAGPGLMLAGGAMRMLGWLATPTGMVVGTIMAVATLTGALVALNQNRTKDAFGTMEVDIEELRPYVAALGEDFQQAYGDVTTFSGAVEDAVSAYDAAAISFSQELLTKALAGAAMTPDEAATLQGLGQELVTQVKAGVQAKTDETGAWLTWLFGGENAFQGTDTEGMLERDVLWTANGYYSSLKEEAYEIGEGLRDAMTEAFEDKTLDGTEYARIMAYYEELNAVLSEVEDYDSRVRQQILRHKAASVTEESFDQVMGLYQEYMDQDLTTMETSYEDERARLAEGYDTAIAWTGIDPTTGRIIDGQRYNNLVNGLTPDGREITQADIDEWIEKGYLNPETMKFKTIAQRDAALEMVDAKYAGKRDSIYATYGELAAIAFATMAQGEGTGHGWNLLSALMEGQDPGGNFSWDKVDTKALMDQGLLTGDSDVDMMNLQLVAGKYIEMLEPFRNLPLISDWIEWLDNIQVATDQVEEWVRNREDFVSSGGTFDPSGYFATPKQLEANRAYWDAQEAYSAKASELEQKQAELTQLNENIATAEGRLTGKSDVPYWYETSNAGRMYDIKHLPQYKEQREALEKEIAALQLEATEAENKMNTLALDVQLPDGATLAKETLEGAQTHFDNHPLAVSAYIVIHHPGAEGSEGGLEEYAQGGRATTASIFGEAGAEWAIPESHSQRTADLLDSARSASGFTWPELIARTGGLNAEPSHEPVQMVYAPVIHAGDARGVEKVLLADKERFFRMMKEYREREEMASYG